MAKNHQNPKDPRSSSDSDEEDNRRKLTTDKRTFSLEGYDAESARSLEFSNPKSRIMSIIPELEKITFRWCDINVYTRLSINAKIKNSCKKNPEKINQILKQVNGVAYPGELLGIMGASGAGKTTLLNILTLQPTKNLTIEGGLFANGEPVNMEIFRQIMAYVNQEDLFIGALTVREHLIFRAQVCLDHRLTKSQKMSRINDVITDLGLYNCQNTVIGIPGRLKGISGGEMKRLSFASEVLNNPSLMFCDEPTSGLDSSMASNVVAVLKRLAKKGKTIVCTIHQPSSDTYALFDKILLMAQGRVAFLGTLPQAKAFFAKVVGPCPKNYNPADYFIQILAVMPGEEEICKKRINKVCNKYDETNSLLKQEDFPEISSTRLINLPKHHKASYCSKWRAVMWRAWISFIRDPLLLQLRVMQTILVAALLGVLFYDRQLASPNGVMDVNSAMYIVMISISLQNAFSAINVFCEEIPVFMREQKKKLYHTHIYFMCKIMIELPVFILIPFLFASIAYYLIGLNISGDKFILAMFVHVLAANVATGFGYLASSMSDGISMALAIGPTIIMPLIIFGGFFINVNSIPFYFRWISTISWFRHGNEAMMIIQWGEIGGGTTTTVNFPPPVMGMIKPGEYILKFYHFSEDHFVDNIYMLFILAFGYRIAAFLTLVIRTIIMR